MCYILLYTYRITEFIIVYRVYIYIHIYVSPCSIKSCTRKTSGARMLLQLYSHHFGFLSRLPRRVFDSATPRSDRSTRIANRTHPAVEQDEASVNSTDPQMDTQIYRSPRRTCIGHRWKSETDIFGITIEPRSAVPHWTFWRIGGASASLRVQGSIFLKETEKPFYSVVGTDEVRSSF